MKKDVYQLCKQFDRVAESYDENAVIHQKMAYRLLYQIKNESAKHILEIGCQTGFLTQLLLDRMPNVYITAVSVSERMIDVAKEKISDPSRVRWIICDYEEVDLVLQGQTFDMIVSNASLHWLKQPAQAMQRYHQVLNPGGCLIASTFGTDTFRELRKVFQIVEQNLGLPLEEHVLSLPSLKKWENILEMSGFEDICFQEYWMRPESQSCEEMLRTVKGMGENCNCARQSFVTSYRVMSHVIKKYNCAYRSREGIYATIHVNQFAAYKSACTSIVK